MPTKPLPSSAPDEADTRPAKTPRRRRRHVPAPRGPGPKRPGRFFRPRRRLDAIRRDMKPVHLGECDWLLYRRRFNPYRPTTFKARAYDRGFAACKAAWPKPRWAPIP